MLPNSVRSWKAWRAFPAQRELACRNRRIPKTLVLEELEARTLLSFLPAVQYSTGQAPLSVATADLRGIGVLDLIEVNQDSNNVSVLLGNGDGSFWPRVNYAVGRHPKSVAVGDFNLDGIPDLVVANKDSNTVSVLLGNGDGTFMPATNIDTGDSPESVAVGDFKNTGAQVDFVVANNGSNSISVYRGNLDGSTFVRDDYTTGPKDSLPSSVAVGDVDGDGFSDIVVSNTADNTVSVFINNQDGTFQQAQNYNTGAAPVWIGTGDLRGSGFLDIVTANNDSNDLSVLFNNFDGRFAAPVNYAVGPLPTSLAVADINGDGAPDLVTTNLLDGTASLLINNGDGTFRPRQTFAVRNAPSAVVAGDFNQDGFNDLAVANANSNNLSVLINDGNWSASPRMGHGHLPIPVAKARDVAVSRFARNGIGHGFSLEPAAAGSWDHSSQSAGEAGGLGQDQAVGAVSISTGITSLQAVEADMAWIRLASPLPGFRSSADCISRPLGDDIIPNPFLPIIQFTPFNGG